MATTRIALVDLPHRLRPVRSLLAGVPGVTVAVPTSLRTPANLDDVDVVIVGVFDDRAPFDHVVGVPTIAHLRSLRAPDGGSPPLAALADRPVPDVVRLRLAAAGTDLLLHDPELPQLAALVAAGPSVAWHADPRSHELREHGIGTDADVNGLMSLLEADGLQGAFDGSVGGAGGGLTRRRAITVRARAAELLGMVPTSTGTGAVVERTLPSWRQITRLVDVARGADARD